MIRSQKALAHALLLALPLACLSISRPARAYVDLAPTLSKIVASSRAITLVEVADFNRQTHTLTLKPVRDLKGAASPSALQQVVLSPQGLATPRPIVQWAAPGARGVLFSSSTSSLVCFGEGWYQVVLANGVWKLDDKERPDLPLAYYGSLSRLADAVDAITTGKSVVITAVAHNTDNESGSFDLALNRQNLPGLVRLQRMRASASMPQTVAQVANNPAYFIGIGAVDEAQLPDLLDQLKSADPMARAEAADDLRTLGRKAKSAVPALTDLLKDATPRVRFEAAAALLTITPKNTAPLDVIAQGLASGDLPTRRLAARAAGFSGPAASPLTEKLAAFLQDPDEALRMTALQSIALLGPAADKAATAVIPLLDNQETAIDAADALGRIGPAARPALPRLTQMLSSPQSTFRWAAVRAMAQIGGPDAHPAVDFMVKAMPTATEVEGYNMMIYLSLLGPVAQDAAPAIQSFRIKNPVLPSATLWALAPERSFPWNNGGMGGGGGGGRGRGGPGGFGNQGGPGFNGPGGQFAQAGQPADGNDAGLVGFGNGGGPGGGGDNDGAAGNFGPGGGGPGGNFGPGGGGGRGPGGRGGPGGGGGGGPGDLGGPMMQAYVHELGARLRPLAPTLAQKIMDGSAGQIPVYGYQILAAGPDLSLNILTPGLANGDLAIRERATVALGYMGPAASPAKDHIEAALKKSDNPREQRLLQWCLREIDTD